MQTKNGLKRIADAISRRRDVAAVLVPRRMALELAEEMYPDSCAPSLTDGGDDALGQILDGARMSYLRLVKAGGYIGTVMSVPMVVADDVVVCPLTERELRDSAQRLGVDMRELDRDRKGGGTR